MSQATKVVTPVRPNPSLDGGVAGPSMSAESNKALVLAFYQRVVVDGHFEEIPSFVGHCEAHPR